MADIFKGNDGCAWQQVVENDTAQKSRRHGRPKQCVDDGGQSFNPCRVHAGGNAACAAVMGANDPSKKKRNENYGGKYHVVFQ